MADIHFRPHHFLCALGYAGKGYSDAFTANMSRVVSSGLRAPGGDGTRITVTHSADVICAPCPKRRGAGCVETDKISQLDAAHAQALNLKAGDSLSWADAKTRMSHLPDDIHDHICTSCKWKPLGLCRNALRALKDHT